MRNLLDEAPSRDLHGGALTATRLLRPDDLRDRDVLDIGCGFGWFLLHALAQGARRVTGIDVSDEALATARRHVRDARLVVGSATRLPFPDASFDTVTAWEVIEHVPRGTEAQMLAEIARVLTPGGVVCLSTPHAAWASKLTDPAWPLGHRHYRRDQLRALAAPAFTITNLTVHGGVWSSMYLLNVYVAKWIFRRPPFLARSMLRRVDAEMRRPGWWGAYLRATRALPDGADDR